MKAFFDQAVLAGGNIKLFTLIPEDAEKVTYAHLVLKNILSCGHAGNGHQLTSYGASVIVKLFIP